VAARAVKQAPDLELLVALQAARASAKTLFATGKGEVVRSDGKVTEFDTVPLEDVQAEERRLTAAHGLLLWTDRVSTVRTTDYYSEIHATFTLVHLTTGATKSFEFVGPCFPLSDHNNNGAWASAATKTYAWRCAVLDIFDIPVRKKGQADASPATPPQAERVRGPFTAAIAASQGSPPTNRQPYTGERLIEQLTIWSAYEREMEIASRGVASTPELAMAEAWAACRGSAESAGIPIRPLMPGDRPGSEIEHIELYDFLYAENLRNGQVPW